MKLCILFPGIGYTVDRSLLYFSGRLAISKGYEVRKVGYHDLPKDIKGDEEKKQKAFEMALGQIEEQLSDTNLNDYSDILFIGKSIGTAVAAAYGCKHLDGFKGNVRYIYLTPLEQTFRVAGANSGIVFTGTADPWVVPDKIVSESQRLDIPCYRYEDANHSLETGDVERDIAILSDVMAKVDEVI